MGISIDGAAPAGLSIDGVAVAGLSADGATIWTAGAPQPVPTTMDEVWALCPANLESGFRFTFASVGQDRYRDTGIGVLSGSFNDSDIDAPNLNRVRRQNVGQALLNQPSGSLREVDFSAYAVPSGMIYVIAMVGTDLRYFAAHMTEADDDGIADIDGLGGGFFRTNEQSTIPRAAVRHMLTSDYDWRGGVPDSVLVATFNDAFHAAFDSMIAGGIDCIIGFNMDASWHPFGQG